MELVDVLYKNGKPTGQKATIDEICDKGLWHNSVHAIIITIDNKIVVQKRSKNILMNPGLLELSAGGIVNTRETCEQAIRREVKEELGIDVRKDDLVFINAITYNKHYTKLNKTAKAFLHTYVVKLHEPIKKIKLQKNESAGVYFLSLSRAKTLVRLHRLARLGRTTPFYTYWKFSLDQAIKYINPSIHFVCRGNTFRSRLAEEYLRKHSSSIVISSSGVEAKRNFNGQLSYMAKYLLKMHHIVNHKKSWQQTTQKLLDNATLVVFMSPTIYKDAQAKFNLGAVKFEIWSIPDVSSNNNNTDRSQAEIIYKKIVVGIKKLQESSYYKNLIK